MRLTITARADDFIGARVSGATSDDAARLIAAAPELLEALRGLLRECERERAYGNREMGAARRALATATGEA